MRIKKLVSGEVQMNLDYNITIPTEEECGYIRSKLLEYNITTIPLTQEKPFIFINKSIKDENDMIIGGILACLALWNTLSIDTLWVKEEFRNNGIAKKLLSLVETEAIGMGCQISYLSTYDFQAKDFYLKNGYELYGTLNDCPKGHKLYHLSKMLEANINET